MHVGTTRGTTPTHTFTTDTDLSDVSAIYITYSQRGRTKVEKTIDDVRFGYNQISVVLSQADTLQFNANSPVYIQIRGKFADGSTIASNIMEASVGEILKEGEI